MAGLLDGGYSPDPLAMGLLGMGGALLTPRQLGGGIGPAMQQFSQQAMQAQMLKRQMAADAERSQLMRERTNMDREEFGFKRQQYETAQRDAQARQARIGEVRQRIATEKPDLLPLFDMNPDAAMERLFPKAGEGYTLAPGAVRMGPDNRMVAENPRAANPPAPTDIKKMMDEMNALPPGSPLRAIYEQAIRKSTTHAPAANTTVYTGTMVPVERPDGTPGYVMPGKDGSVLPLPGVQPPGTAKAREASEVNTRSVLDRSKLMLDKIDSALGKVGFTTTAIPGAVLGKVPGSGAYDLRAEVETLKANFGFQELQQMRASSPTGGALGNVAVRELDMLQAAVQNLDPNQSPDQLKRNLQAARQHVTNWRNAVQMSGGKAPAGTQQRSPNGREVTGTIGGAAPAAPSVDDLLKKYGD